MMNIYKKKYNIQKLIKILQELKEPTLDIDEILTLIGFDPIDVNNFYINNIRGRFRYDKDYNKDTK